MEIKTMYIVTKPTPTSEMCDIFFEADILELELMFAGGLHGVDIVAIYSEPIEALRIAKMLLADRNRGKRLENHPTKLIDDEKNALDAFIKARGEK